MKTKLADLKLFNTDKLFEAFTGFLETKIELIKLDAREEISRLAAKMIVYMVVALAFSMVVFFLTFSLAAWLNYLLESSILGYLLVAVIYGVFAYIIYTKRSVIIRKVIDSQLAEDQEDDQNDSE